MKRITALILLLMVLCPLILGCESSTPSTDETQMTIPDSGAAANQTVAEIDIVPNEVVIETTPYAWGVKYLELPPDEVSINEELMGLSLNLAITLDTSNPYYDKRENVIKLLYSGATGKKSSFVQRLAVYDMKGNYLRSEDIPKPDFDKESAVSVKLTEYGYIDLLKQSDSYILYKYYFETGETEVIFEDLKTIDTDINYNDPEEDSDGNFYFFGKRTHIIEDYGNGRALGKSSDCFTVVSPDGEVIFNREWPYEMGHAVTRLFSNDGIVYIQDGKYNIVGFDIENRTFKKADLAEIPSDIPVEYAFKFMLKSEPEVLNGTPTSSTNTRLIGNGGHDVYYITSKGIYGHNFKDPNVPEEHEMIVDFMASGVSSDILDVLSIPTNTCILGEMTDIFIDRPTSIKNPCMIFFDEVAAQTERTVITLAHTKALPSDTNKMIAYFNMTTPQYRITTADYSVYDDPAAQLMKEFGTGKYPDLIYITDDIDYNNLTAKGFMYNLYDLGITPEMVSDGIRTMCEYGGGLYKLPMIFSYVTLLSRDGTSALTLTDLAEQYKTHGNKLLPQFSRDRLLDYMIKAGALGGFVDYANAKCNFNDPEFVNFLEFLRTYNNEPTVGLNPVHLYGGNPEYQQLVKGGDAVYFASQSNHMSGLLAVYNYLYDGMNYTYCGFPTTYGSGIIIDPEYEFGITKASANPEGAMAFLRMMFDSTESEQYLWKYNLRTNAEILGRRLEEYYVNQKYLLYYNLKNNYFTQFEFTGVGEGISRFYNDPETYFIPEVSDEEIEYFVETILNAEVRSAEDVGLLDILYDELTPYLAGQDTASNTANRINSRVGIYLAERYS